MVVVHVFGGDAEGREQQQPPVGAGEHERTRATQRTCRAQGSSIGVLSGASRGPEAAKALLQDNLLVAALDSDDGFDQLTHARAKSSRQSREEARGLGRGACCSRMPPHRIAHALDASLADSAKSWPPRTDPRAPRLGVGGSRWRSGSGRAGPRVRERGDRRPLCETRPEVAPRQSWVCREGRAWGDA